MNTKIQELISHYAVQERAFLEREFMAPQLRDVSVHVRIGGVLCTMRTRPREFTGWGVYRPNSHAKATLVREATLSERRHYLDRLLRVRVVVVRRQRERWFCSAANWSDSRLRIEGLIPIELSDDVQMFDVIQVRFDGRRFWFDEVDLRHDPRRAIWLRTALDAGTHPRELDIGGLTPEIRAAYHMNFVASRAHEEDAGGGGVGDESADSVRRRLGAGLQHAGAELVDYGEHRDGFRVTYKVDGQQHVSFTDKEDLTIQTAGFCLDDLDRDFDLASLVGVIREGNSTGELNDDE